MTKKEREREPCHLGFVDGSGRLVGLLILLDPVAISLLLPQRRVRLKSFPISKKRDEILSRDAFTYSFCELHIWFKGIMITLGTTF